MVLSIVILTHNQKEVTARCLNALSCVSDCSDIEVIVVDNGSTDGSHEYLPSLFKGIYLYLPENCGVANGRNEGIRCASGKYVMLLDNDTIPTDKAIAGLVQYLEENDDVGLVAPRLVSPDGETQASFKAYPGLKEKLCNVLGRKQEGIAVPDVDIEPFYVIGACQVFRRELIDRVGVLDGHIFFGPEDADFCMRIRESGMRVVYTPAITIIHDWQRSSARRPFSRLAWLHAKALLYFYRKHRRWWK